MNEIIHGQVVFLLASLCSGMLVMAGYELIRLIRWLFKHNALFIWIEDVLYWLIVSVPVFQMFFYFNEGEIRWYGVVMLICGGYIYYAGISCPMHSFIKKIIEKLKKKV